MFIIMVGFFSCIMVLPPSKVEKIADDILSSNEEIFSVSVIDWSGNILAVKSKESFRKRFRVSRLEGSRYSGTLAIATLSVVNEVKDAFGEAQAIISIHKDCKLMLLPMPLYEILVGLALEPSAIAENQSLTYKIERLLAETVK
jgi:hypothetical protein